MSDQVGNPEDRFSRVAAHIVVLFKNIEYNPFCCVLFRLGAIDADLNRIVTCVHDSDSEEEFMSNLENMHITYTLTELTGVDSLIPAFNSFCESK